MVMRRRKSSRAWTIPSKGSPSRQPESTGQKLKPVFQPAQAQAGTQPIIDASALTFFFLVFPSEPFFFLFPCSLT